MTLGRRADAFAKVGLVITAPLLLVALLEAAARVLGLSSGFFLRPRPENCLQRGALLEMEPRPNCVGELRGTKVRTNSLGLRGGEVRDDGSTRILAIGDSCTWGWRVEQNESYPEVLQRLLDGRYGRGKFQVINAGVAGYTSYRGLLYLRERGLALHPSIVIAGYGFNDASPGGDEEARLAENRMFLPLLELQDFLMAHSHFYGWARWTIAVHQSHVLEPAFRVAPDRYRRNLSEIVRLSRDNGAKVLMLSFVTFENQRRYLHALSSVVSGLDVPLLSYSGPKLDLVHPTAAGYRMLAGQILDRLEAEGWLGPAPS
jgi:lysophospholipase L1-like esterase